MQREMKSRHGLRLFRRSHCDRIPSTYFHLLCVLDLVGLRAVPPFHPQPCPVGGSSDSLQFPAVLLSQWRIKGGSIKGKQGGIHSIACVCSLYLLTLANPCELEAAEHLLYVDMWGTMSPGAVVVLVFTLSTTLTTAQHNHTLSVDIEFCSHYCIIISLLNPTQSQESLILLLFKIHNIRPLHNSRLYKKRASRFQSHKQGLVEA